MQVSQLVSQDYHFIHMAHECEEICYFMFSFVRNIKLGSLLYTFAHDFLLKTNNGDAYLHVVLANLIHEF